MSVKFIKPLSSSWKNLLNSDSKRQKSNIQNHYSELEDKSTLEENSTRPTFNVDDITILAALVGTQFEE